MTDWIFTIATRLMGASCRHLVAATDLLKDDRWFDAYWVGAWGHLLGFLGRCVGEIGYWLDGREGDQ